MAPQCEEVGCGFVWQTKAGLVNHMRQHGLPVHNRFLQVNPNRGVPTSGDLWPGLLCGEAEEEVYVCVCACIRICVQDSLNVVLYLIPSFDPFSQRQSTPCDGHIYLTRVVVALCILYFY